MIPWKGGGGRENLPPKAGLPVKKSMASFCCSKNDLVIEVEFKLVWRKEIKDPLEKLRKETKDGKLGELKIDTDSVKIKS